jgi:hypothetical protein
MCFSSLLYQYTHRCSGQTSERPITGISEQDKTIRMLMDNIKSESLGNRV